MLIASRSGGEIDGSERGLKYLKRVAYLNGPVDLSPLVDCGFLIPLADDSTAQADARPETETETEEEVCRPVDPWPVKPKKDGSGNYIYPPPFERAWSLYPKRPDNPKMGAYKAFRARVKSGDDLEDLIRAAGHYRTHCQRAGKEGTEFTKQASTFYGPSEPWRGFVESPGTNGKRPPAEDRQSLTPSQLRKAQEEMMANG